MPSERQLPGVTPQRPVSTLRSAIRRLTRVEIGIGALIAVGMVVLVVIEPDILEAPFENGRTLLFTLGGTVVAAIVLVVMLRFSVPAIVRIVVLVVPFAMVNWWLISPYFRDEVVDEGFATSIEAQSPPVGAPAVEPTVPDAGPEPVGPTSTVGDDSTVATSEPEPAATTTSPQVPVLLGAGRFVGLAGHSGTGDAAIFRDVDGSLVLRFENFDIENGPDLAVYLVPGADQTSLPDGTIPLGELKGNVGNQNYRLPLETELAPGAYTALVWCEAFSVEFVGATIVV